eukprot:scaffold8717_cov59-Cyclotella_meneghiniana.AAC.9
MIKRGFWHCNPPGRTSMGGIITGLSTCIGVGVGVLMKGAPRGARGAPVATQKMKIQDKTARASVRIL